MRDIQTHGRVGRRRLRPLVIEERGDKRLLGIPWRSVVVFQARTGTGWQDVAVWSANAAALPSLTERFFAGVL